MVDEIFLDLDPQTGIATGVKWTEALWRVNARCEAVICLLSRSWANSKECHAEYRQAEGQHKPIFCAGIEDFPDEDITRAWQRCDLFGDGPATEIDIDDGGPPVRLRDDGLQRLLAGLRAVGIGADSFPWPPPDDTDRSPYRGWQPQRAVSIAWQILKQVAPGLGADSTASTNTEPESDSPLSRRTPTATFSQLRLAGGPDLSPVPTRHARQPKVQPGNMFRPGETKTSLLQGDTTRKPFSTATPARGDAAVGASPTNAAAAQRTALSASVR